MDFSYGKRSRDLTNAAHIVNEMVEEFLAMELNRYSKNKTGRPESQAPRFSTLAEANFSD